VPEATAAPAVGDHSAAPEVIDNLTIHLELTEPGPVSTPPPRSDDAVEVLGSRATRWSRRYSSTKAIVLGLACIGGIALVFGSTGWVELFSEEPRPESLTMGSASILEDGDEPTATVQAADSGSAESVPDAGVHDAGPRERDEDSMDAVVRRDDAADAEEHRRGWRTMRERIRPRDMAPADRASPDRASVEMGGTSLSIPLAGADEF
jgi:hypothetical protein